MSERGSESSRAGESARLFCALDLPGPVVERVAAWQRSQAAGREDLRPVAAESLHVTLAFLGERPAAEIPAIAEAVAGFRVPVPVEGVLRPAPMPLPARRPRLLALEIGSPGVVRLQDKLAERLVGIGAYQREGERRFWPHLTVFRLRGRAAGRGRRGPVCRVAPLPGGDGHAFGFVRVALYRSQLGSEGSTYYRLAATEIDAMQPGGRQKR